MFGSSYFGSLVFAAGLVVTSQTPVPPAAGDGNGLGTTYHGSGVFGAGLVVTSQTPVPPTTTGGNGIGTTYFGAGVFGAGLVVTSQTPVPPPSPSQDTGGSGVRPREGLPRAKPQIDMTEMRRAQTAQIEAMLLAFLHTQSEN